MKHNIVYDILLCDEMYKYFKFQPAWVAPSFDSFAEMSSDQSNFKRPAMKRQKRDESSSSSRNIKTQSARSVLPSRLSSKMTWVEKYTPVSRSELAVHPKKIEDVHTWLTNALKSSNKVRITNRWYAILMLCSHYLGIQERTGALCKVMLSKCIVW
jgi:hypothetical protein